MPSTTAAVGPSKILYDNMKQVRLDPKTWNPGFIDFIDHYGIIPKTHRPYRPRTKGKVERIDSSNSSCVYFILAGA